MEKIMAVFDKDAIYAVRFMEYFKKYNDTGFEIMAFTRIDSLTEFLELKKIEILLLGDGIQSETIPKNNIKHIFCLTGQMETGNSEAFPKIYKYQSARAVLSDILSCYQGLENQTQSGNSNKVNIITIVPLVPDDTKLSYTWFFAGCLAEKKKVLFIPLELFPIQRSDMSEASFQCLSDFIYYLKEKNPNLIMKMKPLLKYNEKLSYLSGISHGFDLLAISKEDISHWIEEFRLHSDYEEVVFYLGLYTDAMMELVNLSDSVYFTIYEKPYERSVLKEWKRQMQLTGINMDSPKYKEIALPCGEPGYEAMERLKLKENSLWVLAAEQAESGQIRGDYL